MSIVVWVMGFDFVFAAGRRSPRPAAGLALTVGARHDRRLAHPWREASRVFARTVDKGPASGEKAAGNRLSSFQERSESSASLGNCARARLNDVWDRRGRPGTSRPRRCRWERDEPEFSQLRPLGDHLPARPGAGHSVPEPGPEGAEQRHHVQPAADRGRRRPHPRRDDRRRGYQPAITRTAARSSPTRPTIPASSTRSTRRT